MIIVNEQDSVIAELATFSYDVHSNMQKLDARVAQLERNDAYFRMLTASNAGPGVQPFFAVNDNRVLDDDKDGLPPAQTDTETVTGASAKRTVASAFEGEGVTTPGRTKHRKKLEVKIPGKAAGLAPGVGLPTPMPSVSLLVDYCAFGI